MIADEVMEALENYRSVTKSDAKLEEALEMYHELIKNKVIAPRENQLLGDSVLYQKSNFFRL